jgi:hypothetical protein
MNNCAGRVLTASPNSSFATTGESTVFVIPLTQSSKTLQASIENQNQADRKKIENLLC